MTFYLIIGSFMIAHFATTLRVNYFISYLTDNKHHLHEQ